MWVGRHDADAGILYQPGNAEDVRDLLKYLEGSWKGAKYLINPVSGQEIDGSYRSGSNIIAIRYLLIESDKAPIDLWLKMLVLQSWPIVALYESGRRSIHAIVRVDAKNEGEFKAIGEEYRKLLIPLEADEASTGNKVVQLSRLPGVFRPESGHWQRLLWLAPNATGAPIWQKKEKAPLERQ